MNKIRLSFNTNNSYIVEYNYVSNVLINKEIVTNFYKMLSFYKKNDLENILINATTLKDVENELNKIGFYLYMVRHLKNVNYFYIIKDNVKNKILYNNSGTLAFINSNIDVIDSTDISYIMDKHNIKNDMFNDLD